MKISVVVCTYNRSKLLKRCLMSLVEQNFPKENYEIVLIDNASTDDTKNVIFNFIEQYKLFTIRYIYEPTQGLSFARNRGYKESKNEIVAYIDDDAIADKDWIKELSRGYTDDKIVCVGGKLINKLDEGIEPPSWFSYALKKIFLGETDFGEKEKILENKKYLVGSNISFRKEILELLKGFKTDLGRFPDRLCIGEETEIQDRIRNYGFLIKYNPHAIVWHVVTKDRTTKTFYIKVAKEFTRYTKYRLKNKNVIKKLLFLIEKIYLIIFFVITYFKNYVQRREKHYFYAKLMLLRNISELLAIFK